MMKEIDVPEFSSYEEEAKFWDNFDMSDYMEDDGKWLQVYTPNHPALKIAILSEIIGPLMEQAQAKEVSVETLLNVLLADKVSERKHERVDNHKTLNRGRMAEPLVSTEEPAHHAMELESSPA